LPSSAPVIDYASNTSRIRMEESVETSAKTVAEAVELALLRLGLRRRDVEIEVLSEGRSGLFGLGAEDARVRVRRLVAGPPPAAGEAAPVAARPPRAPRRAARQVPPERGSAAAEPQEASLP